MRWHNAQCFAAGIFEHHFHRYRYASARDLLRPIDGDSQVAGLIGGRIVGRERQYNRREKQPANGGKKGHALTHQNILGDQPRLNRSIYDGGDDHLQHSANSIVHSWRRIVELAVRLRFPFVP